MQSDKKNMPEREVILGKNLQELQSLAKLYNWSSFIPKQICNWVYQKGVSSFDDMTNLSKSVREVLKNEMDLGITFPISCQSSADGTKKYLFDYGENKYIEAAYIPDKDRATLCVSSQVGCKMGCFFCMTGKQGLAGNLTATQILNQIMAIPERDKLSNIVYMGMGEPMDNIDHVLKSIEILTVEEGLAMSPKRITVSTIGVIPSMIRFLEECTAHLAVSMHSPFEEERTSLMPIQKKYPIQEIVNVLKRFDMGRQRRISFEYIMFKGINDTFKHVKAIVKLLHGLKCRMNLISFHPVPGLPYMGSSRDVMEQFRDSLCRAGITTTIRASRGQDIEAACGLLSTREKMKGHC